ncbi:MAG TPA: DciA family protein [Bauldia sp.]|jgi:hypothetical protein
MSDSNQKPSRRGPVALGELIGRVIDPVTKRRGFATTDLIAAWPEIVGSRFADCTRPEKIVWSRGEEMDGAPALLVVRVDGPRAIFVQHEAGQIIERVNAFLGYGAIGHLRIIQAPVSGGGMVETTSERPLSADAEAELEARLSGVADKDLRSVLDRLGRGVLAKRQR